MKFSPVEFSVWMKTENHLSDDNCDVIVGKVFIASIWIM